MDALLYLLDRTQSCGPKVTNLVHYNFGTKAEPNPKVL